MGAMEKKPSQVRLESKAEKLGQVKSLEMV